MGLEHDGHAQLVAVAAGRAGAVRNGPVKGHSPARTRKDAGQNVAFVLGVKNRVTRPVLMPNRVRVVDGREIVLSVFVVLVNVAFHAEGVAVHVGANGLVAFERTLLQQLEQCIHRRKPGALCQLSLAVDAACTIASGNVRMPVTITVAPSV